MNTLEHSKYTRLLFRIALDIPYPVRHNARHAAAVVFRKEIVSLGVNELKTHPFQAKYAPNEKAVFVHAENQAIMRAMKELSLDDLQKSLLYVVRIKRDPSHKWVFGMSKPCSGCERCIRSFGLKRVIYTTEDGYAEL